MTQGTWKNKKTGEKRAGEYEQADAKHWYVFISGEILKKIKSDKPEYGNWELIK